MACSADELETGLDLFLDRLLRLVPGERLLVYADGGPGMPVARAMRARAVARGCFAEVLELDSALPLPEQAGQLAQHIRQGRYQAICELSEGYFYLTPAWEVARVQGARVFSLQGLDEESFVRCVAHVDHDLVFQFGLALARSLQRARTLHVTSERGTDIRMVLGMSRMQQLTSRLRRRLERNARTLTAALHPFARTPVFQPRPRAFVAAPCGELSPETTRTFLGGQLAFRGIPSTIEGTAVIDGCQWPPDEIGHLDEPITLEIKKGVVSGFGGCPVKSRILARRFAEQSAHVEHFCVGFNPHARVEGRLLEAERALAGITVGIGEGFLHTDGVIRRPRILADGEPIAENGSFNTPELLSLQQKLTGPHR